MDFNRRSLLLLLLGLSCGQAALADSYRCGRKLVRTGDSAARLIEVCGEPSRKGRGTATVRQSGQLKELRVERWYYRTGRRSLERAVLLHRGRIVAIEVGGR